MPETPPTIVKTLPIACDGDAGPSGHPRIYLTAGRDHRATCPYCGRVFEVVETGSHAAHPIAG